MCALRSQDNFQESVLSLHRVLEGVTQAIRPCGTHSYLLSYLASLSDSYNHPGGGVWLRSLCLIWGGEIASREVKWVIQLINTGAGIETSVPRISQSVFFY